VEQVTLLDGEKKTLPVTWKRTAPDTLQVHVGLQNASPGAMTLALQQYGQSKPDTIKLRTYTEAASLGRLAFHSGDTTAILYGKKLDEVVSVALQGLRFLPVNITQQDNNVDALNLKLEKDDAKISAAKHLAELQQGEAAIAHVALKDGRTLDLSIIVQAPRPVVSLLGKSVQWNSSSNSSDTQSGIVFQNQDDLPQSGRLSFFVKSVVPALFPRTESIEIASADGSFHTTLSITNGTLVLQDARTVFAELDPEKSFGASAFGALQFRAVDVDGLSGDWQPLANLVRVPTFQHVRCPMNSDKACTLRGNDLFLLDSVASDSQFQHSASVPLGFAGESLSIPRPVGATLYIRLRDDPSSIITIALPVLPENAP
jgi:hypothetical protein